MGMGCCGRDDGLTGLRRGLGQDDGTAIRWAISCQSISRKRHIVFISGSDYIPTDDPPITVLLRL